MSTYEMLWDCEYCGTQKLLGLTHRFCPNCGAAQNPAKRYFPSESEKVAVENHKYVGVDVVCPNCQTPSAANAEFCGNCGTPLTEAAKVSLIQDERTQAADLVKEKFVAEQQQIKAVSKTNWLQNLFRQRILAGIVALVLACCGLCAGAFYLLTITEDHTVEAVGHSWEREIEVLTFQTVSESDWESSVPNGAFEESCSRRQSGTRRIPDGETCTTRRVDNGDGTFSEKRECKTDYREEPVYDNYCSYKINKWVVTDTAEERGSAFSDPPVWPTLNLKTGDCLGCQKQGEKHEKYVVKFRDTDTAKSYECEFERENEWANYAPQSTWTVKITKYGDEIDCDSLKRASG